MAIDLGPAGFRNPHNLYDMMIPARSRYDWVATLDGEPVPVEALDEASGHAFTRLGDDIYQAREQGWRWLLERTGLQRMARAADQELPALLRAQMATLPEPTAAELAATDPERVLAVLPGAEQQHGQRSLWRLRAFEIRRSVLARDGLAGLDYQRLAGMTVRPQWADPATVEAILDGREITRGEMRLLAGFGAELAREEYHRLLLQYLDQFVARVLVEREARGRGVTVDALEREELAALGPITDAEVRAFIADNPQYGRDAAGRAAARDNVRRLREAGVRTRLEQRLRAGAKLEVHIARPEFPAYPLEPPSPRPRGEPAAPATLVVFHSLGCPECNLGTALMVELDRRYRGRLRILSVDHFRRGSLVSYRAALALHCAAEQGDFWPLMLRLLQAERPVLIDELADAAAAAGLDRARMERCLLDDRYLPDVLENLLYAERLGLERSVPALFLDGRRLMDLGKLDRVIEQVDAILPARP